MSSGYTPLNTDPFSAHQLVLEACAGARSVLDVGCSAGTLAAVLTAKGAVVDGVEADAAAAAEARRVCRHVMAADIEAMSASDFGERRYDAVVMADVLEHLREPEALLHLVRGLLGPDGWIVVSTPNIANWSVRLQLLAGRFEYTDRGIMDRTHVHFFTRRSVLRALRRTGFHVARFDVTCPLPVLRRQPFTAWAHRLARAEPGLLAYQFVITARAIRA